MRLERGILEETPNGEGAALALGASRAAALRAELDRRTDLAAAPNDAIGISFSYFCFRVFGLDKKNLNPFRSLRS